MARPTRILQANLNRCSVAQDLVQEIEQQGHPYCCSGAILSLCTDMDLRPRWRSSNLGESANTR